MASLLIPDRVTNLASVCKMTRVATYVFMDLEVTGLPKEDNNKTRIIEVSFIAVKRSHMLGTDAGSSPRVQQKVTLCLNPGRMISPISTNVTYLSNDLLEYEPKFNEDVFNILNTFLNILTKPVCLIAQNGLKFDFPILKNHIEKLGKSFSSDLLCADCYHAFYQIIEQQNKEKLLKVRALLKRNFTNNNLPQQSTSTSINENETTSKSVTNESTSVIETRRDETRPEGQERLKREYPWSDDELPKKGYRLSEIYEKLFKSPPVDAHQAEVDSHMALKCSVALKEQFVDWVDNNFFIFSDIKPMTIGEHLGE